MYSPFVYTKSGLIGFKNGQNNIEITVTRENKADDKYLSIALASNIAKVKRDNLMVSLSTDFPHYGWDTNKGYGTLAHRNAIQKYPENQYFRKSFLSRVLS
jgi:ribonuclease HII